MDEYIKKEDALKVIKQEAINQAEQYANRHHPAVMAYGDCFWKIKNLPTTDVKVVKHGKWTLHSDGSGTCNLCNSTQIAVWDVDNMQNYCGKCGAEMDGGINHENN